jgi:NodT family efflux transporter outer membrane factor (OMF) lipoprotein
MATCASCALGPNFKRPAAPGDRDFIASPTPRSIGTAAVGAQRFEQSNRLAADWWRLLHCAKLDALVAEAYANNPTLQSAQATLRKSQDALRAGYGVFSPQVDASLSASRQRVTPQKLGITSVPATMFNLFSLGVTVSYALDVWGGQRRSVESLRAQAEAQRYQALGSYLLLSGNVVNTVIAAAAYRAEIDATRELIAIESEQVHLGQAQAQAGTAAYANVLSLESQLALTQATLPPLEQKIDQARHLLATLAGRTPASFAPPAIALADLSLPAEIPLSLPSQLVHQRPDILVAEAQLHSSTALIGVATAALLPSITIGGGVGANNTQVTDLFSPASLFWNAVGGIVQPLFHGGALWYQRKQAIDARDAALADYRQTVLAAFAQVADALSALSHDADALSAQAEALHSSEEALKLVQINYQSGLADYLSVLTANSHYLQARIGYVEAQAQRLQDTVALFVALGGGWWNATKPPA